MAEKIRVLGKRSLARVLFIWSGILSFILNLFGCADVWEPAAYAPPFFGDFTGTGSVVNEETLLPVKGIRVSVHMFGEESEVNHENYIVSDITDENGEYDLRVEYMDVRDFILYFYDIDPDADGNYHEKKVKLEMPLNEENYTVDLETKLNEVDE